MDRSAVRDVLLSFETLFALTIFTGIFELAPPLSWFPIDPTIVFGLATAVVAATLFFEDGVDLWKEAIAICGLFSLFTAYALLSILWSPSTEYALSKGFRLVSVTAAPLILGTLIIARSRVRLRRFFSLLVVLGVITALETLQGYVVTKPGRTISPFGTAYLLPGRLLGMAAILVATVLVFSRPSGQERYALGGIFTLLGGALLFSGARGPMIGLVTALAFVGYLAGWAGEIRDRVPTDRRYRAAVAVSSVTLLAVLLILVVAIGQYVRGIHRLLILTEGGGRSLSGRIEFYGWTINHLVTNPTVFGHGLGSWPVHFGAGDIQHYPHNIVLEVAYELGLVGFILITAIIGYACRVSYRGWRRSRHLECAAILALIVFMLINTFVSGDINGNRYLWIVVGLAAYRPHRTHKRVRRTVMSDIRWPISR